LAKSVPEDLREKAALYEERNALYGDNYKRFGEIMMLLLNGEVELTSADDYNRFGVFVQIVAKVTRYGNMFHRGGHADSLDDNAVYSLMLAELDREIKERFDARMSRAGDIPEDTDAEKWASFFIRTIQGPEFEVPNVWDHNYMTGWFANAIERGRTAGYHEGLVAAKEPWDIDSLAKGHERVADAEAFEASVDLAIKRENDYSDPLRSLEDIFKDLSEYPERPPTPDFMIRPPPQPTPIPESGAPDPVSDASGTLYASPEAARERLVPRFGEPPIPEGWPKLNPFAPEKPLDGPIGTLRKDASGSASIDMAGGRHTNLKKSMAPVTDDEEDDGA
jgi:hypothetical protein